MAWNSLVTAFGYGSRLTSAQMQFLRDNITALANGDAGAPPIQSAALATISASKLSVNVGEARLHSGGTYYEVLAADGVWRQCCPSFGGGGS